MFQHLHQELLDSKLDVETKIVVVLVCSRFDGYSNDYVKKLIREHDADEVVRATRRVDLRTDFHKPLLELIVKKKITSTNIDQIEEEVEFLIFKLDRDLQKHAHIPRLDLRTNFQVFVKGSDTLVFDIDGNTTVAQLKAKFQERTGIPVAAQRLTTCGKPILANDCLLQQHYNIQKNSTIMLTVRASECRK